MILLNWHKKSLNNFRRDGYDSGNNSFIITTDRERWSFISQRFKVKCSDNTLYRINPVYAFIEKDGLIEVEVRRLPGIAKPDKVLILCTAVSFLFLIRLNKMTLMKLFYKSILKINAYRMCKRKSPIAYDVLTSKYPSHLPCLPAFNSRPHVYNYRSKTKRKSSLPLPSRSRAEKV